MQNIRYKVWNRLTEWKRWWYYRVILCTILIRDLLGLLPIYLLVEVGYSLLNRSHCRSELVNGNYLGVHVSLI